MGFYRLSFVAANLMPAECRAIAMAYTQTPNWLTISQKSAEINLIGKPRSSSVIRQTRELVMRLRNLDHTAIVALPLVRPSTAAQICFLAVLKTYMFIADFMLEVVAAKWAEGKDILRPADYFDFYESKAIMHPELSEVAPTTQQKLRTVLFCMLQQAGYLHSAKDGILLPPQNDHELASLIRNEDLKFQRCLGVCR